MPDLRELLDHLDALRTAATATPWVQQDNHPTFVLGGPDGVVFVCNTGVDDPEAVADAALIVAGVNALPKLIAAVRAALDLADDWGYKGEFGWGPWQAGEGPDPEGAALDDAASKLRKAITKELS